MNGRRYNIGAQNQHADSGTYEFHIHRAYIIYGGSNGIRKFSSGVHHRHGCAYGHLMEDFVCISNPCIWP